MPGPGGPGGGYRGYAGGGMGGGMGTASATFHYRMMPPSYMGAYRRSRRDGLLPQTAVERLADRRANRSTAYAMMQGRHGFIKGTIVAFRGLSAGGLRQESMFAKCERAAKDLEAGKITQAVYLKRCINAHKTYASYLVKIGYFTEKEYYKYMKSECESLGVDYEYAPEGRSR